MATTLFLVESDEDDNFLRFWPSPRSPNRANLSSQEKTKVWCAFVETRTKTKKKASIYNRWKEWKRSVTRSTEQEKLHTRSGLFSIEFLLGTGCPFAARGPTWRVTSNYPTTFFSLCIARHRSGVNTLTVASQFPIVFFFPSPSSTFLQGYWIQPFRSISRRSSFFIFIYFLSSFLPSCLPSFLSFFLRDCNILIVFISRATILISCMIAIFRLLPRFANSSRRILLTKLRGGEKQGGD